MSTAWRRRREAGSDDSHAACGALRRRPGALRRTTNEYGDRHAESTCSTVVIACLVAPPARPHYECIARATATCGGRPHARCRYSSPLLPLLCTSPADLYRACALQHHRRWWEQGERGCHALHCSIDIPRIQCRFDSHYAKSCLLPPSVCDCHFRGEKQGWKLTILLEEMVLAGSLLSFAVKEMNLDALEHKEEWYLKINPNGRIPALVDHGRDDFAVFESGAMMLYLAETYGAFMPSDVQGRYSVIQWLCFQISGVGPMQGQAHAFLRYVPEIQPYAVSRYQTETRRLYEVLDGRLAESRYAAGDELSIADFALYPWVAYHQWAGVDVEGLVHVSRWLSELSARVCGAA